MDRILTGTDFEGRYRIDEELGAGGVGTVFRATHLKLGRPVAIKVLQEKYGASRELRQRFEREAFALAALAHPHVVTVTDYGVSHGMPYLVMELLEGETLADRLDGGPLPTGDAIDILKQLLKALMFVHERGLVHRDMKPGNVFLQEISGSKPHVKVLDFGLAKFLEQNESGTALTRTGQVFGTPSYMAPEQIGGEGTDERTDIYAAGVILFEMLAGRPPFRGNVAEVMRQHLVEPLPGIEAVNPGRRVAPELHEVLERATAKTKALRYQSARDMSEALEALPPSAVSASGVLEGVQSARTSFDPASTRRGVAHETGRYVATTESEEVRGRPLWVHVAPPVVALIGLTVFVVLLKNSSSAPDVSEGPLAVESTASDPVRSPASDEVEPQSQAPPPLSSAIVAEAVRHPAPANSAPPATAPLPERVPSIRTPAELWRGTPKTIAGALDAVEKGTPLSRRTINYVHDYNAKNPGDPRGHFLLARSYMLKGWRKDATNEYAIAHKLNPDVAVDPRMLRDLVEVAKHGSPAAVDLLKNAFGSRAIAAVDAQLAETGPNRLLEARLRKLRDELQ